MTRSVFNCLIALTLILATASKVYSQSEDAVRLMEDSTVRIVCMLDGKSGVSGTGFVVGGGKYVVTNAHVIDHSSQEGCMVVARNLSVRAHVKGSEPERDLALLQLESSVKRSDAIFAPASLIRKAQVVFAVGFPGVGDLNNIDSALEAKITRGVVSAMVHEQIGRGDVETHLFETDAAINKGNSGGPLFTECAEVVGINTLKSDVAGVGWSIYIEEVYPLLDRFGVSYRQASNPCRSGMPSPSMSATGLSGPEGRRIWAGAAGAFLLTIIGVVVGRRSTVVSRDISGSGREAHSIRQRFYLVAVGGPMTGRRYPLTNGTITVGRDPARCQVVFPPDATDVSRLHFWLRVGREGSVMLEDANSTRGTFLESGERLCFSQPRELRVNERFYLGSPGVMFQLTGGRF